MVAAPRFQTESFNFFRRWGAGGEAGTICLKKEEEKGRNGNRQSRRQPNPWRKSVEGREDGGGEADGGGGRERCDLQTAGDGGCPEGNVSIRGLRGKGRGPLPHGQAVLRYS